MQGKYRSTTANNKSRFFILLSVIFVFIVAKWGIPWFFSTISGGEIKKTNQGQQDIIPPQVPVLITAPEATNSSSFVIEGYTESGATVMLYLNEDSPQNGKADNEGKFKFLVKLVSGENKYLLKAVDDSNNSSQTSTKTVLYDNKPVDFNLVSPADGTEFIGRNNQVVLIEGKVNKQEVTVLVNNSFTDVNKDGKFVYKYQMSEGDNKIKINVSDKSGNFVEKEITLKFSL